MADFPLTETDAIFIEELAGFLAIRAASFDIKNGNISGIHDAFWRANPAASTD